MSKFKMLYLPLFVLVAMLNIGNLHGSASSNEDGAHTTSCASSSPIITVLPSDSGGIVTKIMDGKDIS